MNDFTFPDSSEGRRAHRAEIQRLKQKVRKLNEEKHAAEETMRKKEEAIRNLPQLYSELTTVTDDKIDPLPLTIIRNIYLHKKRGRLEKLEKYIATTDARQDCFDRIKSLDPLCEEEKRGILQAVYAFDRAFFKSLIDAMDLCEFGGGIENYNVAAVIICHDSYTRDHGNKPTNSQLLALLKEIDPIFKGMDQRTLRGICKDHKLTLSPAKRGRPFVNSGVKAKRPPN